MGIFMKRLSFCRFFHFIFKLKPSTMGLWRAFALFLSSLLFIPLLPKPLSIYKQSFSSAVFDRSFCFVCLIFFSKKGHFRIVLIANIKFVYKIGTFHCMSWPILFYDYKSISTRYSHF